MTHKLMIQGTMSNAGKSLLVAGLCRYFARKGYRVSPFKSQNMALNSFITEEGLEMGRAQVMQAEAAKTAPSVSMNPILLKPTSDTGSQVIVNGEGVGNMDARTYFSYKKTLIPDILNAFRRLEERNDILIIEGAGSPAEINLKENDVVNMGLAKLLDAPVLLVGDIDRGGVFAQLYGTYALLEEEERARIKGMLINKFRGDSSLLTPGIRMLEEKTGVPVLGTLPYLDISLDDEDSLSERLRGAGGKYAAYVKEEASKTGLCEAKPAQTSGKAKEEAKGIPTGKEAYAQGAGESGLLLAVVRLPHISNFTDFHALEIAENAVVVYTARPEDIAAADAVVLPGSKNTLADLRWLKESGMEEAVRRAAERGALIFGICGGYQMLGISVSDPKGIEAGGQLAGMGLLPVETTLRRQKRRAQVSGAFAGLTGALSALNGQRFRGYELHQGVTRFAAQAQQSAAAPFLIYNENGVQGDGGESVNEKKPITGSGTGESREDEGNINENHKNMEVISEIGRRINESNIDNSNIDNSNIDNSNIDNNITDTNITNGDVRKKTADVVRIGNIAESAALGNIFGTYVHGLFDEGEIARTLIAALVRKRTEGSPETGTEYHAETKAPQIAEAEAGRIISRNAQTHTAGKTFAEFKEAQYELLADAIEKYLDMPYIERCMGL